MGIFLGGKHGYNSVRYLERDDQPDEFIKAALEEANIPALMVSLVHVTGDMNIIRGDIRPHARALGDPHVGITEAQRATVRVQALEILTTLSGRWLQAASSHRP